MWEQFGLILTHILMTVLTGIMVGIYICVNIVKLKNKEILKQLGISVLCVLGISAFFWMPMMETYFFADYTVYQEDSMATTKSLYESGLDIKTLLYTDTKGDTTHVFEVGIPILMILTTVDVKSGIESSNTKLLKFPHVTFCNINITNPPYHKLIILHFTIFVNYLDYKNYLYKNCLHYK